ncbi:MAG: hypothetical protein HY300_19410, partial [Verrucomicrobia bacterium]|nr:hypothetical protein [Verrucomicrobiota bacterium]
MNSKLLPSVFAAALFLSVGIARVSAQVLGGYSPAPVNDPEVQAAAKFATSARDAKLKLLGVERAQQQVVAGQNFRLTLKVDEEGAGRVAEAVVWRKLDGKHELTSWQWQP